MLIVRYVIVKMFKYLKRNHYLYKNHNVGMIHNKMGDHESNIGKYIPR